MNMDAYAEKHGKSYPVIIMEDKDSSCEWRFLANIPDFGIYTEGRDFDDAIEMAKDAIGAVGLSLMDEGKELPKPGTKKPDPDYTGTVVRVEIDFEKYRKEMN